MSDQEIQDIVERVLTRLREYERKQVLYIGAKTMDKAQVKRAYPTIDFVFKEGLDDKEDLDEIWLDYLSLEDAIKAGLALRTSIGHLFNHLLKGKKIVVLDSCFNRDYKKASPGAKNLLAMYKKGLEDQGLIFEEKKALKTITKDETPGSRPQFIGKKLLTEKDLLDLEDGQVVNILDKTIVTALARDLAREKNIQLIREGSKDHAGR